MTVYTRLAVVRFWHRLCTLPEGRITQDVFRWSCNLADGGVHNWATEVRKLLGDSQCNSDQMNFNRKDFLDSAWDALAARELEGWSRSLWTFPRGSES